MTDLATVRSRLEAAYQDMSRQQRRAARYVLSTPTEIALYPLRQVATRAGVGAATLVRLANSMGFSSYNAFRELFREDVRAGADRFYGSRAETFISRRNGFDALYRATGETLTRSVQEAFDAAPPAEFAAAGRSHRARAPDLCPGPAQQLRGRLLFPLRAADLPVERPPARGPHGHVDRRTRRHRPARRAAGD